MDNLMTLCLLGLFVVAGMMLLPRLLRGFGSAQGNDNENSVQGTERPSYDDPNVRSRGGFGRGNRPGRSSGSQRPSTDSPDVRSRGGFGRDKD